MSKFIPGFCCGMALALAMHYFIPCDQAERGGPHFVERSTSGE